MFTRYLDNSASGFARLLRRGPAHDLRLRPRGLPLHRATTPTTRAARGRRRAGDHARPGQGPGRQRRARVHGRRRRPKAPAGAAAAGGHRGVARGPRRPIRTNPAAPRVRLRDEGRRRTGPSPAYNADNGYVHYQRDANADLFENSESSYDELRQRRPGASYCDDDGNIVATPTARRRSAAPPARHRDDHDRPLPLPLRRPLADDRGPHLRLTTATTYGPDLVDRWKARAFAQDPASETPCCGYEEEDTNWGGSSHAARRARRPGARDPRDVGRRLRHERDPPRDLLPRRDAPEDLAARARDPAARRHLRAVGLQRRPR